MLIPFLSYSISVLTISLLLLIQACFEIVDTTYIHFLLLSSTLNLRSQRSCSPDSSSESFCHSHSSSTNPNDSAGQIGTRSSLLSTFPPLLLALVSIRSIVRLLRRRSSAVGAVIRTRALHKTPWLMMRTRRRQGDHDWPFFFFVCSERLNQSLKHQSSITRRAHTHTHTQKQLDRTGGAKG